MGMAQGLPAFERDSVYCGGLKMGHKTMVSTTKRKTSLTLVAEVLDGAKELKIKVSAVTEAALKNAVASVLHSWGVVASGEMQLGHFLLAASQADHACR